MDNPIPAAPSDMVAERRDKWALPASSRLRRGSENAIPGVDDNRGSRGGAEAAVSDDCDLAGTIPRISGSRVDPDLDASEASGVSRFCRGKRVALYKEI